MFVCCAIYSWYAFFLFFSSFSNFHVQWRAQEMAGRSKKIINKMEILIKASKQREFSWKLHSFSSGNFPISISTSSCCYVEKRKSQKKVKWEGNFKYFLIMRWKLDEFEYRVGVKLSEENCKFQLKFFLMENKSSSFDACNFFLSLKKVTTCCTKVIIHSLNANSMDLPELMSYWFSWYSTSYIVHEHDTRWIEISHRKWAGCGRSTNKRRQDSLFLNIENLFFCTISSHNKKKGSSEWTESRNQTTADEIVQLPAAEAYVAARKNTRRENIIKNMWKNHKLLSWAFY